MATYTNKGRGRPSVPFARIFLGQASALLWLSKAARALLGNAPRVCISRDSDNAIVVSAEAIAEQRGLVLSAQGFISARGFIRELYADEEPPLAFTVAKEEEDGIALRLTPV